MIRAISHALPVTSSTTRSSVPRLCANSSITSGRVAIRPADRTLPCSAIATSQKSRCTSSPIDLTLRSLRRHHRRLGRTVGQRHRRIRARSATRPVARGGHRFLGLERPSSKAACPRCVLPKAPRTQYPDRNPRPGRSPRPYFHAPISSRPACRRRVKTLQALRGVHARAGASGSLPEEVCLRALLQPVVDVDVHFLVVEG